MSNRRAFREAVSDRFTDRVAFVTGAASGMGRAIAVRLAAEGAVVRGVDVNGDGLEETATLVADGGGSFTHAALDVTDRSACARAVESCVADLGGLDVLANVAGVVRFQHAVDLPDDQWDLQVAVNLTAPWTLMKAAFPHLEATGGNVVNIASAAGLVGQAYTAGYAATKHGLVGLSKSLGVEWAGAGVRVNAVCPGQVDTPLNTFDFPDGLDDRLLTLVMPHMRQAQPEEVAALVAYLASDEARYITGTAVPIDGAQTAG